MFKKTVILKSFMLSIVYLFIFCFTYLVPYQKIYTIEDAYSELQKADDQTIVVFDVDGTLTDDFDSGRDLFHLMYTYDGLDGNELSFITQKKAQFIEYVHMKGHEDTIEDFLLSSRMLKHEDSLIEPFLITNIINDLMVRWVKVIALTALPAEKFGIIPCMSELRFSQLQKHGIDFSRLFTQEKIIIDTLNVDQYNNYPAFYKGIVFSGVNKKGKALEAFFDKIDFHPSKVLFFDDNLNNVKNVEKIMKACSVECYGYWYRAVDKLLHGKFNREIVEVQLTGLLEKDQYITVAEAEDRILQRNDFESEEVEEEEYD